MSLTKRIICLANSRKKGGRCIAGVEIKGSSQSWIRPVSNRENQEVLPSELQYENGNEASPLDIIHIPLLKHIPHNHQQENWLLDTNKQWKRLGTFEWNNLHQLSKTHELWEDGHHENKDRVSSFEAGFEVDSLRLVYVKELTLKWELNAKRRWGIRGYFNFANRDYALKVTDVKIERRYRKQRVICELKECFLTISLGGPFGEPCFEYCYKLIAAVIEKPRL